MAFFTDYKDEIKKLISDSYVASNLVEKEFEMSTLEIVIYLRNILPENAVDEYNVYEALKELGFKPEESAPLQYSWYFKRKNE